VVLAQDVYYQICVHGLRRDLTLSFIAQAKDGISFLGFRIFPNLIRLTHRNIVRFSKKHREMIWQYYCGLLTENQLIRKSASLIGHIGHADTLCMRQHFFYKDLFG
jgi:hypothetical protein